MIQELLNICVHASDNHTFLAVKTLIGTFVHCRKHKVLWSRLTELYEPILFRSLAAVNSVVRRHAVIIFTARAIPAKPTPSRTSSSPFS